MTYIRVTMKERFDRVNPETKDFTGRKQRESVFVGFARQAKTARFFDPTRMDGVDRFYVYPSFVEVSAGGIRFSRVPSSLFLPVKRFVGPAVVPSPGNYRKYRSLCLMGGTVLFGQPTAYYGCYNRLASGDLSARPVSTALGDKAADWELHHQYGGTSAKGYSEKQKCKNALQAAVVSAETRKPGRKLSSPASRDGICIIDKTFDITYQTKSTKS
jgi:hypothetical protein